MKEVKLYTAEDMEKEIEEGHDDVEVALKKWKSILEALEAVEEVSVQITSFCLKYQKFGCKNCPITRFDYPCGHPYATFTIFYQELRKLRMVAERLYAVLLAIDREDKESRKHYV